MFGWAESRSFIARLRGLLSRAVWAGSGDNRRARRTFAAVIAAVALVLGSFAIAAGASTTAVTARVSTAAAALNSADVSSTTASTAAVAPQTTQGTDFWLTFE